MLQRVRAALLASAVLLACQRDGAATDAGPRTSAAVSDAAMVPEASAADASPDGAAPDAAALDAARAGEDASTDDDAYTLGVPRSARSIGHTSVVLKLELSTGRKAVFKPASRRGPTRYKGEIAARRLGVALGLPNVPKAYFRALDAGALGSAASNGGAAELFTKEAIVTGGVVKGALIPWIEGLSLLPLERQGAEWRAWLSRDAPLPDDRRALAAQISTLVAFDFVTGNWDRWSGGNVGVNERSGMLLFIDNDGAFFETPPEDALRKNEKLLLGVDRFSRSFVRSVRVLDDDALARAMGEEAPGVPLLSKKALRGVQARLRKLLAILDEKEKAQGEALLAFP